jgi:hypothetical protein
MMGLWMWQSAKRDLEVMSIQVSANPTAAAIWGRIMKRDKGRLSPEAAQAILNLDFTPEDQERVGILSQKAREGTLSASEQAELEEYLRVNDALTILQSRARQSLKRGRPHPQ